MTRARHRREEEKFLERLRLPWKDAPEPEVPRSLLLHADNSRGVLAQCETFVFDASDPAYKYFTRYPFPVWRDGNYIRHPTRFTLMERVVHIVTGTRAVRVWLTPAQVERMKEAVAARTL